MKTGLVVGCVAALLWTSAPPNGSKGSATVKLGPTTPKVYITSGSGLEVEPCRGAGCESRRVKLPKKNGGYDYAGLRAKLAALKKSAPKQRGLLLVPQSKVRWGVVVQTMAQLRKTADGKPLYPAVVLGVAGE